MKKNISKFISNENGSAFSWGLIFLTMLIVIVLSFALTEPANDINELMVDSMDIDVSSPLHVGPDANTYIMLLINNYILLASFSLFIIYAWGQAQKS